MIELKEYFENTADQTPIEIALQVDTNGTVSTRNLYEFLELLPDNFTTWCKRNILDNEFAAKNEDYHEAFFEKGFASPSGGSYKRTLVDYKLSVHFAKKLCMIQRNERGEQARDYFIKVEQALKTIAQSGDLPQLTTNEMILQLAANAVELERKINAEMSAVKQSQSNLETKLDTAVKIFTKTGTDWRDEMDIAINDLITEYKLSKPRFRNRLYSELSAMGNADLTDRLSRIKNRMKKQGASKTECNSMTKLDAISRDKKLRPIFEGIIKKYQVVYAAGQAANEKN